jgi:hypothetical protein
MRVRFQPDLTNFMVSAVSKFVQSCVRTYYLALHKDKDYLEALSYHSVHAKNCLKMVKQEEKKI